MECFQYAAGVLAPLLALTIIWTSIQQHRLSRQGLSLNKQRLSFDVRLTLLDKRLDLFLGMQRFIGLICQRPAHISEKELYRYVRKTSLGEFIFDERRKDILREIYNNARKLLFVNEKTERLKTQGPKKDEEYQRYVEERDRLFGWFKDRFAQNQDDFRDYFEFK